jgi:hypothetical protein
LVETALAHAGRHFARVGAHTTDPTAASFYAKLGFTPIGNDMLVLLLPSAACGGAKGGG